MPVLQGNTSSGVRNTGATTLSFNHTIPNQRDRILFVTVFATRNTATFTINGVTYGGTAMTELYASAAMGSYHRMSVFYLINPPVGTAAIEITASANMFASAVSADFYGVNQASPIYGGDSATGTGTGTGNLILTSSPANTDALMLSFLGRDSSATVPSVGENMTEVVKAVNDTGTGADNGYAGIGSRAGGSGLSLSWSWTNSYLFAHYACSLRPSGGRQFQAVIVG